MFVVGNPWSTFGSSRTPVRVGLFNVPKTVLSETVLSNPVEKTVFERTVFASVPPLCFGRIFEAEAGAQGEYYSYSL